MLDKVNAKLLERVNDTNASISSRVWAGLKLLLLWIVIIVSVFLVGYAIIAAIEYLRHRLNAGHTDPTNDAV